MSEIVVLVSGSGSNLQAIIDAINYNELNCKIQCVIADRECYAVERAKFSNIQTHIVDRKIEKANLSSAINGLIGKNCRLIVLAGFLSILDDEFIGQWENKIINIHPSLLPKFGGAGMWGLKVHQAVLNSKESETGCTVHKVTTEVDGGEIISQKKIKIALDDTAENLQKKVLELEHQALISAISQILA